MGHVQKSGLQVAEKLAEFTESLLLPGTGISADDYWAGLADLVARFGSRNADALKKREDLQEALDRWHIAHRSSEHDAAEYRAFLDQIGYLVAEGPDFVIETANVDPEIASVSGPQLVVPVMNARFALNAANARWGSLYDALYGSDALGSLPEGKGYDPERGAKVIAWGKDFLDQAVPLDGIGHADATAYVIRDGALIAEADGTQAGLSNPNAFAGYIGDAANPKGIVLVHNGLHIIINIDRDHAIGKSDKAGVSDLRLESALSAIMDCEDSVAAVDANDKVLAYGNWLGLMKGTLEESFEKGGKPMTRRLAGDIAYTTPDGQPASLKGRALMFVRNVGHLMTNPAILTENGSEIPEGIMDALYTVTAALHDLNGKQMNSAHSVYVVKPKMHGPDEVALADEIFGAVEDILGLPRYTVKLGIMDEERRTSANLKECIRAARHRVAFVNTGFLDRTGDEIHTSMEAGVMKRKAQMKDEPWLSAYEDRNVDIALACGFQSKGQIGKGMWAMPDRMEAMLEAKIGHPKSGANCAWVPSPTAATLHATHYHQVNVRERQDEILKQIPRSSLDKLLEIPLAPSNFYSEEDIDAEILNNAQGILGYVVRWVDQGVGCSKVPDINDVGQMEDRATCRISSQMLANWLHHGVVSEERVMEAMKNAAAIVDRQNQGDPDYLPMGDGSDSLAFQAACDLVFKGREQPSGYTEPLLHEYRLKFKDKHNVA
ncbi:malate synthase G [Paracoccus aerodenitrificans]|uniref:malate synthase G n=1 Tax=Paracoccus aerodenitrificans TaxID=3017781 RepID=UPI0022F093B2|nr:malate synthase G [Paracoccus aerodenitrificans]WBU64122.1 malate synthase G [Paracoccus aerodenitrificans]